MAEVSASNSRAFEKTVLVSDDVVLAGKTQYDGESFAIILTSDRLRLIHFGDGTEFDIFLVNVYGVEAILKSKIRYIDIHTYVPKNRDQKLGDPFKKVNRNAGFLSKFRLQMTTEEEQYEWIESMKATLAGVSVDHLSVLKKPKFLIIINPFGGTKKAKSIYKTMVWPMLRVAGVDVETIFTTHAGHGFEIGRDVAFTQYDLIATVSGDGLLHEVLNGLLQRPDWNDAIKTPLAIIPGGSGNALAKSLDCEDPYAATFNLLKGKARPMDVMILQQKEKIVYSHLSLTHALIADIDVGSDNFRFFGTARFTLAAVTQLFSLPKYPIKIAYLPHDAEEGASNSTPSTSSDSAASAAGLRKFQNLTYDTIPSNWVKKETALSMLTVSNSPWLSTDYLTVPLADFSDGHVDMLLVENTTSSQIVPYFLELEKGTLACAPFTEYLKIKALYIEPTGGIVAIDGEPGLVAPTLLEVLPQLARIITPTDLRMPPWTSLKKIT